MEYWPRGTLIAELSFDVILKNISDVKKGEAKKVQVTEWLKSMKLLWGQEEKIYQQGCAYKEC